MSETSRSTSGKIPATDPWPESDVELLVRLVREGRNLDDLCEMLRRDQASVCMELSRLAIRQPEVPPALPQRQP